MTEIVAAAKVEEILNELAENGMGEVFIAHSFEDMTEDLMFDLKQEINGKLLESPSDLIVNSFDLLSNGMFKMVVCDGKELFELQFGAYIEKIDDEETEVA